MLIIQRRATMPETNPLNEIDSITLIEPDALVALAAVEDYWTEQQMAEAQPVPFNVADADAIRALTAADFLPEGEERTQAPLAPDGGTETAIDNRIIDPLSYNTSKVADRSVLPYCTVGKLFMQFDGSNYVGTAWTIAEKAVFTAGHCIFDRSGGGWADKVLFVPQYHRGTEPVGRWAATRLHSLVGWTQNRDFKYDMGVFEVDRLIRPTTGSLGWMANFPPNQGPYTSIGYPAALPFDGQEMWQSVGAYIDGSNPIQMHNNMTGGCSGGPWVAAKSGGPFANGLNSFRYNNNPNTMYSPYFGQGFLNLYDLVKNIR
jgi:V8-like Glu-specific endopeptidase